ncbi:cell wall-binding protein [Duganella dendranthematis]|uniref:Cell wall-binding protein n=3 Tax=Duganella TaxID=75654 RepID=A0A7X4KH61_9BURK|nr:cell wall-binding protein [Duganella margarita]QJD93978.1 cell wall-binding protein [Duganella dendranthematis]
MWQRRRDIGVKYKNVTPEPLRDYIYEVNTGRYNDPLGPSFDSLVKSAEKKMLDPYQTIIDSSSRPNSDVNALLSKFEDWLAKKDASYLDAALKKVGN